MFTRYSRIHNKLNQIAPKNHGIVVFECRVSYENPEISEKNKIKIHNLSVNREFAVVIKRFTGVDKDGE